MPLTGVDVLDPGECFVSVVAVAQIGGLRVIEPDLDIALTQDWRAHRHRADVVRLRAGDPADWDALRTRGFAVKPTWVTWGAPLTGSREEFLSRVSPKELRNVRKALDYARVNRLRFVERTPISPEPLDEFLRLYGLQIARMVHGVPYAQRMRQRLLDEANRFMMVSAHDRGGLVAGCICSLRPDQDVMRIAFSAIQPRARDGMLSRAIYLTAADAARARGLKWISLGSDPTLYGHVAKPGLFTFKSRLGFAPVPLSWLDYEDVEAYDEAELMLSLSSVTDPSLSLAYAAEVPPRPNVTDAWSTPPLWRLNILASRKDIDIRPFAAPFLDSLDVAVLAK